VFALARQKSSFIHNQQSLRIVDFLERRYAAFPGLNLTLEVRQGLMKHVTEYDSPNPDVDSDKRGPSLEAQVVNLSDEISYNAHDAEDGLYSGLLSKERATECFYVDLVPGEHMVQVRGSRKDGVGTMVEIAELSAGGSWWYPTFSINCGAGGPCDRKGFELWRESVGGVARGLHAPCGSTRVRKIGWKTGRMPDMVHPEDIYVEFILDIYQLATKYPPGSKECERRGARPRKAADEDDEGDAVEPEGEGDAPAGGEVDTGDMSDVVETPPPTEPDLPAEPADEPE